MLAGIVLATFTYLSWGCYPLYWKQLDHVAPLQITAHRILWSFITLEICLIISRQWKTFHTTGITRSNIMYSGLSGFLVGTHWLLWLWTVNSGYIVEASLGSFMISLTTMLLGVAYLKERLRTLQWIGILIAFCGVGLVIAGYGTFPWRAFVLAITFGLYGLVKKQTTFDPVQSMTLEFGMLSIPALYYLVFVDIHKVGVFGHGDIRTSLLLVGGGVITAIPYVWFAAAAQRLPMTVLGVFAFIVPTGNLLIGVLVYNESFSPLKLIGFVCVWTALGIFTIERHLHPPSIDEKLNDTPILPVLRESLNPPTMLARVSRISV